MPILRTFWIHVLHEWIELSGERAHVILLKWCGIFVKSLVKVDGNVVFVALVATVQNPRAKSLLKLICYKSWQAVANLGGRNFGNEMLNFNDPQSIPQYSTSQGRYSFALIYCFSLAFIPGCIWDLRKTSPVTRGFVSSMKLVLITWGKEVQRSHNTQKVEGNRSSAGQSLQR